MRSQLGIKRAVVIIAAVSALAACDSESTAPDASTEAQLAFIDNIVPHHQIATMMADEALAKAVHAGLKTIAERMKADQGREIAEYREIRKALVGIDTTPAPMTPAPIPAGPDFDRKWILEMINHHQGAINSSTLAHGSGVQSRLDSLAHHTIEEQKKEQQELRDSLRVWYPGS